MNCQYSEPLYTQYKADNRVKSILMFSLILLACIVAATNLAIGSSDIGPWQAFVALFEDDGQVHNIVWMLRLPRVVLAALVGFGLGLAGAVFQAILRNPLASPFTLGIGSGAGFGAVSMIIFFGGFNTYLVAGGSFVFALLSALLILGIARLKNASSETMILAGIAQMFLFSSLTSLLQYMGTMEQVHEIVFWFFGSLSKAGWPEICLAAVMILVPVPILLYHSWDFNLLAAGDESAKALGINVERLKITALLAASLMTAGCICFTGVISFVGLVAPHITRMVIGSDYRFLLPVSGFLGAVLLIAADTLGRTVWAPQVLPIGIVTSIIGVPFFFYLLLKKSREFW